MAQHILNPLARSSLAAVALFSAAALPAQSTPEPGPQDNQERQAPGEAETDMIFRSGEDLTLTETTSDDLFAAGSTVTVAGALADHLIIAAGDAIVRDAAPQDMFVAGGDIQLNRARIADDLVAAGGDIAALPGFDIGGTAVLAGGTVRFEAPVGGDLRIGAGDVFVNSQVAGDVRLTGERVVLGPDARIGGDLFYRTENLVIEPGAEVSGSQTRLTSPDHTRPEDTAYELGRFMLYAGMAFLLSYAVIVLALVFGLPRMMRSTSMALQTRPWRSLGIGAAFAVAVPVLIVLLAMSAIGLPLAILLIAISVALTPIAFAVTAHTVGTILRGVLTKRSGPPKLIGPRILWPLLGTVVLFSLTLIPLMGIAIWFFAMLFGLGALLQQAIGALPESEATAPARAQPLPA